MWLLARFRCRIVNMKDPPTPLGCNSLLKYGKNHSMGKKLANPYIRQNKPIMIFFSRDILSFLVQPSGRFARTENLHTK